MVTVLLEDGTQYMMDTDDIGTARCEVDRKLSQRLDSRKIESTTFIPAKLDSNSKYYNPIDSYKCDHTPLKACSGWSYKWGNRNTEFR